MSDNFRKSMKKESLNEIVYKIVDWVKINRQVFFSVAAILLGAALFAVFFFTRYISIRSTAEDKLAIARSQIYGGGNIDQAVKMLDEVIGRYPTTRSAGQARLIKADYYSKIKDYASAENVLKPMVDAGKPKEMLPLALSVLGAIQEDEAKYAEAVQTYNTFIDKFPDHFLAPRIYESMGRACELMGDKLKAKEAYDKIVTLYPVSGWAQRAQERIAFLTGK